MSKQTSHRARHLSAILFAAATVTCARADVPVLVDHFNNGAVADTDSQPAFWNTLVSGTGTATEGSAGSGSLLLNVTGVSGGNQFPFTEIASPLQSSTNFFHAPIVIQASGLNYGPGTNATSLTQFTLTSQALSNGGPNTEYPSEDGISLWIANPDCPQGQVLLGLKQNSPNASTAFDRFQAIGPKPGRDYGAQSFGGQVRSFKLVISPGLENAAGRIGFYNLSVSHDTSSSDPTQLVEQYAGGLLILRSATTGWGTATNPQGDSAVNIESQLNGVADPAQVNPFNVGALTVSQFVTDYIGTGTGNWSEPANWDNADVQHPNGDDSVSNVPNFGGTNVNFGPIASPQTVITDHDETLGVLTLNSAQPYTITVNGGGEGTIHLATQWLNSEVNVLAGSHTIFSPLELHSNAIFTVSQGTSTLTAPTIIAADPTTISLTKAGAGALVTTNAICNVLSINGGTLAMLNSGTSSGVSNVKALNIAGVNNAWTAALDLSDNAAVIDYAPGGTTLGVVANQIKTGRGTGAWNGKGITSSAAAAVAADAGNIHKTALGFAEASALGITSFKGQNFDDSAILIRYTFTGDSNLDGTVNTTDFTALASNFNRNNRTWIEGDFNYDGTVNALDFNAIAINFGQSFPASADALGSLVPEPALASIGICLGFLPRRNRRAL